MDRVYIIDGKRFTEEDQIRDYAFNYTKPNRPFQQDMRLAKIAYNAPLVTIIETFEATGHSVEVE